MDKGFLLNSGSLDPRVACFIFASAVNYLNLLIYMLFYPFTTYYISQSMYDGERKKKKVKYKNFMTIEVPCFLHLYFELKRLYVHTWEAW